MWLSQNWGKEKLLDNYKSDKWIKIIRKLFSYSWLLLTNVFLGAFAKCEKAAISFVSSVCLSVCLSFCPHGTTRLPLDGFSWNLLFVCLGKSVEKIWQEQRPLYMKTNVHFFILSRSVLQRMRNVSDKLFIENESTHFMTSNLFSIRKEIRKER